MSGPYLQDSFNWQAGVDRLWKHWDELLPDTVRPDKPICTNYAEASDAAVALLRAFNPSGRQRPAAGPLSMRSNGCAWPSSSHKSSAKADRGSSPPPPRFPATRGATPLPRSGSPS